MKRAIILLLSITIGTLTLSAQRSDSEIKRDFENGFKTLMKDLRTADSATIQLLAERVQAFESEFEPHKEFLNKSVYPDGYDETVNKLNDQLSESKQLAENQGRILELESQVRDLTSRLDAMSSENAMLLKQLDSLRGEMSALKKTVNDLKDKLARRDAVVFALVDSLFLQYDKQLLSGTDVKRMKSLEQNNVLTNIKRSVSDNLAFLSSTALSASDFPRLLDDQRKFESSWKGLGKKLTDAYFSSKERTRELNEVNNMVSTWRTQVDEAFWKALNTLFAEEKVPIAQFNNAEEFYNNTVRYLDDEINNTANNIQETRLKSFEAFAYNTWGSKVKPVWVPVMKRNEMITDARESEIDTKVKLWQAQVEPGNTMLYILAGALVIAILVGLYLGMKKRPTPAA